MLKKSLFVPVFVCFAFLAVAMMPAAAPAAGPVELSYSVFFPPSHAQAKCAESWAKEIEKRTNGAVKINIFAGGTLTKGPQVYEGVLNGISDIGMSCFAYTAGRFPVMSAIDLPLGYPNGMCASLTANDYAMSVNPPEIQDVKLLYVHAHGPGLLSSKKPVEKLADMAKMKVRATGFSAKVVEALGGVPVAMGQGEAYEALKTGVVEGTMTPIETLKGWKQAEVIKDTTLCYSVGYTTGMYVVMNKDKWASLSPEVQKVFTEVSAEWPKVHGEAWDKADEEGKEYTLSLGNKLIPLSDKESDAWRKAVDPVIANYAAESADGAKRVELLKGLIKKNSSAK
ncbi:MAG: TRAP transporter substrate-binding protein [Thermodesulfobacteriota bacterium]